MARHFTIIGYSFFMLKLTYNSSLLTALGTVFNRYHVQMPMGVSPSSDILKATLDHIFTNTADDIVVVGYDEDDSDGDAKQQLVLSTARR